MIIYDLKCILDHSFEGWFKNIEEYELQVKDGLLTCPVCDSVHVHKIPSAKVFAASASKNPEQNKAKEASIKVEAAKNDHSFLPAEIHDNREAWLKKIGDYVEKHFDDVGASFADEAKRIHSGKTQPRNIMGTASLNEIRELHDEGIPALPLQRIVDKKKLN